MIIRSLTVLIRWARTRKLYETVWQTYQETPRKETCLHSMMRWRKSQMLLSNSLKPLLRYATIIYFSLVHLASIWNNFIWFSLQAAYLVAISDPSSVAGKPGLVDANQFQRARHDIQKACDDLLNPASTQQQVSAKNRVSLFFFVLKLPCLLWLTLNGNQCSQYPISYSVEVKILILNLFFQL